MTTALDPRFYDSTARGYDAVLVVSFGGPEGPDDVLPFLDNVFRGLRVTDETKQRIAGRYHDFGGVSPINRHTREFIAALQNVLDADGPSLPIYWGNRNWHPLLPDTLAQMTRDGVARAAVYVTSTFSSYSGCRKYREDLYEAQAALEAPDQAAGPTSANAAGPTSANAGGTMARRPPVLDKLRVGFNHPGFVTAAAARVDEALATLPAERRERTKLLFTAHSLPESMAASSPYVAQLNDACTLVASASGHADWALVFQSNNARYGGEPWLGPDIGDALEAEARAGYEDAIVMPIGFVCDHMEVVLDLDVDAAARAKAAGINLIRAATVGTHPAYIGMVRDLIVERMEGSGRRATVGMLQPKHDFCPADCCLSGRPGPTRPALCGSAYALADSGGGFD